jgi:hypothetical protein
VKEKTVGGESVLVVQNCRRDVADASSELQPSVVILCYHADAEVREDELGCNVLGRSCCVTMG